VELQFLGGYVYRKLGRLDEASRLAKVHIVSLKRMTAWDEMKEMKRSHVRSRRD